jgi:hypothetical protein
MVSSVFLDVFASVSDTYFKCFICLHTYITSVASKYFKSRLSVAYPFSPQCLFLAFLLPCILLRPRDGGADTSARSPLLVYNGQDTTSLCEQPEIRLWWTMTPSPRLRLVGAASCAMDVASIFGATMATQGLRTVSHYSITHTRALIAQTLSSRAVILG